MTGTSFVIATAVILFVAFMAGWFAHWLISRITQVTRSDMDALDKMAHELHEVTEQRDQAVTYLHQREAQLKNRLSQAEAELDAAMDGLRAARQQNEELQTYIERANQPG